MSAEAWTAIGVIVSALSAGASAVVVAMLARTNRKVDSAGAAAVEARDNTVPVSNGFASRTETSLEGIAASLEFVREALVRHLDEHAQDDIDHPQGAPAAPDTVALRLPPDVRQDWQGNEPDTR